MPRADVPGSLRELVAQRAGFRCEYFLVAEADSYFNHKVDHIISRKHGGTNHPENLAFACVPCNRFKGSDIGSRSSEHRFVRFFNPRHDTWRSHFKINGTELVALTEIAEVTIRIVRFNEEVRQLERAELQASDRYPEV